MAKLAAGNVEGRVTSATAMRKLHHVRYSGQWRAAIVAWGQTPQISRPEKQSVTARNGAKRHFWGSLNLPCHVF